MSALKKVAESRSSALDESQGQRVFEAKPMKTTPDFAAMRARAKSRFSKTLAYLAK